MKNIKLSIRQKICAFFVMLGVLVGCVVLAQSQQLRNLLSELSNAQTALSILNAAIPDLERARDAAAVARDIAAKEAADALKEITPQLKALRSTLVAKEAALEMARSNLSAATTAHNDAILAVKSARAQVRITFRSYQDACFALAEHVMNCFACRRGSGSCDSRAMFEEAVRIAKAAYDAAASDLRAANAAEEKARKVKEDAERLFNEIQKEIEHLAAQIAELEGILLQKEGALRAAEENYNRLQAQLTAAIAERDALRARIPEILALIEQVRKGEDGEGGDG